MAYELNEWWLEHGFHWKLKHHWAGLITWWEYQISGYDQTPAWLDTQHYRGYLSLPSTLVIARNTVIKFGRIRLVLTVLTHLPLVPHICVSSSIGGPFGRVGGGGDSRDFQQPEVTWPEIQDGGTGSHVTGNPRWRHRKSRDRKSKMAAPEVTWPEIQDGGRNRKSPPPPTLPKGPPGSGHKTSQSTWVRAKTSQSNWSHH